MTHTTDEQWLRTTFDEIAAGAVVDESLGRPAAQRALQRRTRRRARRRAGIAAVALCLATVAVVSRVGIDSHGGRVKTIGSSSTTAASSRRIPRALTVVKKLDGRWAPEPIAYDGNDVWLSHEDSQGVAPVHVTVERRDATSGDLLTSIDVPHQEAVFSIASDQAGSVWIAGGGDGGVPRTTVSRIDVKSRKVVFTRLLTKYACPCPIAAGAGAAWIGGNGSDSVLRIDRQTGAATTLIRLPHPSFSIAVVGDRVQVGLDDSRVAVIDPSTNRVERVITIAAPGYPAYGVIVAIGPTNGSLGNSWVTRSDGVAFELVGSDRISGPPVVFLRPRVTAATESGGLLWAPGVDQLLVSDTRGPHELGYANYDADRKSFGPVTVSTKRFVPAVDSGGLNTIVAAGPTLWISEFNGSILVVHPS